MKTRRSRRKAEWLFCADTPSVLRRGVKRRAESGLIGIERIGVLVKDQQNRKRLFIDSSPFGRAAEVLERFGSFAIVLLALSLLVLSRRSLVAVPLFSLLLLLVSEHPIGRCPVILNAVNQKRRR